MIATLLLEISVAKDGSSRPSVFINFLLFGLTGEEKVRNCELIGTTLIIVATIKLKFVRVTLARKIYSRTFIPKHHRR